MTLSTGRGIMPGGSSLLSVPLDTQLPGAIDFNYTVSGSPSDLSKATVVVRVLDALTNATLYSQSLTLAAMGTLFFKIPVLAAGKKVLQWQYNLGQPDNAVVFNLLGLRVDQERGGGGNTCVACPAGHFCVASQPFSCPPGTHAATEGASVCDKCTFGVASGYGQQLCDTCPTGMWPMNEGATCGLPQCILAAAHISVNTAKPATISTFLQASGEPRAFNTPLVEAPLSIFDLSFFGNPQTTAISGTSRNGESATTSLLWNLCDGSVMQCQSDPKLASYGCVRDSRGGTTPLGSMMSVVRRFDPGTNFSVGVDVAFTGAACQVNVSTSLTTTVHLVCDPKAADFTLDKAQVVDECTFSVTARSPHACPICTNNSFVYIETPCTREGVKTRSFAYAHTNGQIVYTPNCYGGEPLPHSYAVTCPWTVTLNEGMNAFWAFVIMAAMTFLLLIGVSVVLYRRHRQIYEAYSRLQQQADTNELRDIGPSTSAVDDHHEEISNEPAVPTVHHDQGTDGAKLSSQKKESSSGGSTAVKYEE